MRNFKNVIRAIKLSWKCDKKYILVKFSMVILNTFFSFISIYLSKILIDLLTKDIISFKYTIVCVLIKFAIDVLILLLGLFQNKYYPIIEIKLSYQVQEQLIYTASKIDYSNFDMPEFYDAMEYALKQTNGLTKSIDAFLTIFSSFINFIIPISICLNFDLFLPIILFVGIIPYYLIKDKLNKYSYDISKEITSIGRKTSAIRHLLTSKYYAHEVRSFNLYDFLISKYRKFVNNRIEITKKSNAEKSNYSFISSLCNLFVGISATVRLIFMLINKAIIFSEYTLLQSYVIKIQTSLYSLIDSHLRIKDHNLYLDNLFDFIDSAKKHSTKKGVIKLQKAKSHKIEFRNVSFSYPNNDRIILDNISFVIFPGESILLIGENGAGKSTMLSLLNGFYENYKGDILIDDISIKKLKPESIWENISIMFQEGALLPMTLGDNIFCGNDATLKFQDYPWFQQLIKKYPNGIDTHLLTYMYLDGIQPSGGEIQRIKLMRTIMKNSGIIVMDEPTNAMDPETEHQVLTSIKNIGREKTTIIVSHNLSCATNVDKIIHLENGKIIEIGSHKELISNNSKYARLFKIQADKYWGNSI